ncbi:MAG: polysaccharide biosynthesis/export family protein [Thiothrix sp.]
MKSTWKLLSALLLVAVLAGCSVANGTPQHAALPGSTVNNTAAGLAALPVGTSGSDRIAPQDLLEIEVFKVPDLSKEVRVDDSGSITLSLIGTVKAAGLTASQLEKQIASRLAKDYMHNPQVSVLVKESMGGRVTVSGAVRKPGLYPVTSNMTVTQAIAQAEGLDRLAARDTITVFRDGIPYSVQYEAVTKGQQPDPLVMAGDKIQVHTSAVKEGADNIRGFIAPFTFF